MKVTLDNKLHMTFFIISSRRAQLGLSLVELLVAISLGIFLTWGAIQAFIAGKQTYITQQAVSQIQETGRMAQELLTYDLRGAGAYGCSSNAYIAGDPDGEICNSDSVSILNKAVNVEYDFSQPVFGADNVPAAAKAGMNLDQNLNPVPVAGTDIVVIRVATDLGLTLVTPSNDPLPASSEDLSTWDLGVVNGGCANGGNRISGICVGDFLALSDCARSKIFQVTGLSNAGGLLKISHALGGGTPGNACATWLTSDGYEFPAGSSIRKIDSVIYYVATSAASAGPALYRKLPGQAAEEILAGVENLQIQYGLDTDNDKRVDEFKAANQISDEYWNSWFDKGDDGMLNDDKETRVIAVRYSLLIRSDLEVLEKPQQYSFNGENITATDRRLRQVLTSTVSLRSGLE